MNKLNLGALLSLGVSLSLFAADTDSVRRLKEHFFAQANQRLQGAQAAFLASYDLDSKGLDNPEMTEVLAQIIEKDNLMQAKKFQSRSRRCLQACHRLCHPHQVRTLAEQQAVLEAIAQRTFEDLGLGEVKIHHDAELGGNVGVMRCASLKSGLGDGGCRALCRFTRSVCGSFMARGKPCGASGYFIKAEARLFGFCDCC